MEKNSCCGNCCWFCFEEAGGWGQCMIQSLSDSDTDLMHCSDLCTTDKYVSREEMRHHMAVLLQANRYRRDDNVLAIYKMPNPIDLGWAIDFAVMYMKMFGKL